MHALVNGDRQNHAFARFPKNADLFRNDRLAFDHQAVAQALQRLVRWAAHREHVIFLGEAIFRMHHAVGDIAVVGEQQQTFGVAIEPPNWIDPLGDVNQPHHRPAVALILDGGDVAARLVENEIARAGALDGIAVDEDHGVDRIRLGAELSDDLAVDADAPGRDQFFRGTP